MAKQLNLFFIGYQEAGWDAFVVGDTVGVEALYDIVNHIGDMYAFFLGHSEVLDDDQRGRGCDQCDFVDHDETPEGC